MEEDTMEVPLTMKDLDERLTQLETRLADYRMSLEAESSKKETGESSEESELTALEEKLDSSGTIVKELEKISEEKEESNRRLKTLNATYIVRIAIEAIAIIGLIVILVGCSFDFGTPEIKPEDLCNTTWTCVPTVMDGMEVMKLTFDEDGIGGELYFMARGAMKTKKFTTVGNEIIIKAPSSNWLFYTDYTTFLNIECGDKEVEFKPYKPESKTNNGI